MSNNGQNGRPGAPQQQLSPPTDPRKRNVPSTSVPQTTQQKVKTGVSRQSDRYNRAMPISVSSGSEHPALYGYMSRTMPAPPPPVNVIAPRDVLLMPPPPPPPPLPLASTTTAPSLYTAPPSVAPTYSCGHPIPKDFDPTQPPPILRPPLNASRKRGATDDIRVGPPNKIRQTELPDGPCSDCVQRDIRAAIYDEQGVKLEQEHVVDETKYNHKFENVENTKLYLKSTMNPRHYYLIEDYIEHGWSMNNLISEPASPSSSFASFLQGTPATAAPRQLLVNQLLDALIGGARNLNNSMTQLQSPTSREDPLLQMLSGGSRRSSVPAAPAADNSLEKFGLLLEIFRGSSTDTANTNASPAMLDALLDSLRPDAESEQRAPSDRAGGSGNGLSVLANSAVPPSPAAVPASAPYAIRTTTAPAPPYYAQPYPPPAPQPVPVPAPPAPPHPQPYYSQQYQQPTPPRHYYAPRFVPGAPQPPAPAPVPPYYANARPPPPEPRAPPPPNQYPQFGPPYPPYYLPGPPGPPY